jgi:hypothetical protein
MNLKSTIKSLVTLYVATVSIATHAQLQLSCPINWNALSDIDGPNPDRVILGMKAREWKKEHLDQMLTKEEECQRNSVDPDSIKKASLTDVRTRAYPNGVRSIEARDQRQQQEIARAQQVVEENQRVQRITEDQKQQQQQSRTAASQREQGREKVNEQYAQQAVLNSQSEVERQVEHKKTENLWIVLAGIAAAIGGWYWNRFVRNRCPICKSTSFDTISVTEIDRWRGTKAVTKTVPNSRGIKGQSYKDVTKHVAATYVKNSHRLKCNSCQNVWEVEKEL